MTDEISVESTGETVGEAKWAALRELERRLPGLDRETVRFQVVTEGERGLLGVGYTPALVIATAAAAAPASQAESDRGDESGQADRVRELLERTIAAVGVVAGVISATSAWTVGAKVAGRYVIERYFKKRGGM